MMEAQNNLLLTEKNACYNLQPEHQCYVKTRMNCQQEIRICDRGKREKSGCFKATVENT